MKKFMIFMLLGLAVLSGRAYGDNGELNFSSNNPQNSLIADCPDLLVSVLYEELGGNSFFYIRKYGNTVNCLKFDIPYKGFIKDMECYGEYLYFCGEYSGNGFVGFLNIREAMRYNSVTYNICYLQIETPCLTQVTSVNKLALYKYDDGQGAYIHVAFVCDMNIQSTWAGTTVGDAYYDFSTSQWNVEYDYNKGWVYDFQDIATTDGYVVAVGKPEVSNKYFLKAWIQSQHFLSTAYLTNFADVSLFGDIVDNLHITKLNGVELAVAYPYLESDTYYIRTDEWKYSEYFGSGPSFTFSTDIQPTLYSLSFDRVYSNILYSFNTMLSQNAPISRDVIGTIACPTQPTTLMHVICHNDLYIYGGPYHCVCGYSQGGYQSSGIFGNTFDMFYNSVPSTGSNCVADESKSIEFTSVEFRNTGMGTDLLYPQLSAITVTYSCVSPILGVDCYSN